MDVITVGDGAHTVLALHGIQGTREAWLPVATRLARRVRFVLPNLRGRGAAARFGSVEAHSLSAYADDVEAVAAACLAGRPFTLAGWSMGVSVALEYLAAGRAPRPRRLVLLSGTPKLSEAPWFASHDEPQLLGEIARREQRLGLSAAADHAAVARTWQAIRRSDQRPLLGGIALPALLLHGREDEDSPWTHATELCAGLPRARLVTIDGAGHGLLTACTARVADELLRFLEQDGTPDES